MIGPEQGRKSGKSGKKKGKAKKAKQRPAPIDLSTLDVPAAVTTDSLRAASAVDADPVVGEAASTLDADAASDADTPTDVNATPNATPVANPTPNADPDPTLDATAAFGPALLAWVDRVQERVDHLLTLVDPPAADRAADTQPPHAGAAPEVSEVEPPGAAATEPERDLDVAPEPADEGTTQRLSLAEAWARRLEREDESADRAELAADDRAVTPEMGGRELTRDADVDDVPDEAPEADVPADETETEAEAEAEADEVEHEVPAVEAIAPDDPLPWESPAVDVGPSSAFDDEEPFEPVAARLSAVLVARELIARGATPADVRRRLREGYGVADPDAVLSQVAA